MAGEKRYRVEILVLTHLRHESVPADAEVLRDFSEALDFLTPIADEDEDGGETQDNDTGEAPLTVKAGETAPGQETGGEPLSDEDPPEQPWADVIAVENMSDTMREAWRRLKLSAPFRPEQYLSWEQSANAPFPSLRIHDLKVVQIDNSCADFSGFDLIDADGNQENEGDDQPVSFTGPGSILPQNTMEENTAEAAEEPELPVPNLFYRIDGTVTLRRSRFLHLDIDLELRQAALEEQLQTPTPVSVLDNETGPDELEPLLPATFLIHELNQSRQVKSRRMEYFDSPVLGVLAWITPFEAEDQVEIPAD